MASRRPSGTAGVRRVTTAFQADARPHVAVAIGSPDEQPLPENETVGERNRQSEPRRNSAWMRFARLRLKCSIA